MDTSVQPLQVTSSAFAQGGFIPARYTGRGEDISPPLTLGPIADAAQSIAVVMDDLDIPVVGICNHWLIWNLPAQSVIPEDIPHGARVPSPGGAMQGIGYGKHRYRGPKPPFFMKKAHRYQFHVYVLDCLLRLGADARKRDLLRAAEGHVLQYGSILGLYQNR